LHYLADWPLIVGFLGIAILAGLLSGIYPALVLSGFRPTAILRTSSASFSGSGLVRTSLVVLQFAVSIGLGIAVAVVFAQISFARNNDVGYQKSGVVLVDARNISSSARDSFVQALGANPQISAVAISDTAPLANRTIADQVRAPGQSSSQILRVMALGPTFANLYGVHLLSGRLLSDTRGADRHHAGTPYNVLVNATAAGRLGFTSQSVVGKSFILRTTAVTVVGVLGDIQMDGPRKPIVGTIYRYEPDFATLVSIRVRPENLPDTLSFIDRTWRAFAPTIAVQRHFLSEDFDAQFKADEKQGTIFALFVGIAIFVACLGLFGLAAFTAERRTKEIGIRKVFGARARDVAILLLWQFSIPVLIANLIAWPLAWYYLQDWLQGFAYRISLSPIYFVAAGLAALLIAWITVLSHALRVARSNPVHALRYE
jgi:putative ABC transport system permease protein